MNSHNDSYIPSAATVVFFAAAILLLPWLGETFFSSKGEPREAIVAVSMLQSGNWLLPVNYGGDIPFKPPFLAWFISVLALIFNGGTVNEFISRMPSALACIAMVCCGYHWGKKVRSVRFGLIYAFVILLSAEVFRSATVCRLDMVLTACMVVALYMLYGLVEDKQPRFKALRYVAVWALLTCAVLTKGPIGSLLPCFITGVYLLFRGKRFFPVLGKMLLLAFAAMLVPAWWFYEAWLQGGDGFRELMMEENIGRLTGNMSYGSHVKPIWYNFVTLVIGLLPWTVAVLMSVPQMLRRRVGALSPSALFSLTAAALTIGFYCIPESKRSVYLLPAYPFICYGIALLFDEKKTAGAIRAFTWLIAVIAFAAPLCIGALYLWPQPWLPLEAQPWWRIVFFVLPCVAALSWFINRHSPTGHCLAIVWTLFLCYAAAMTPAIFNPRSDKPLAAKVENLAGENEILSLVPYKGYRFYTINFYVADRCRTADIETALGAPAGTVLLIPEECDTTEISAAYAIEPLTARSCDYRRGAYIAIKQQ